MKTCAKVCNIGDHGACGEFISLRISPRLCGFCGHYKECHTEQPKMFEAHEDLKTFRSTFYSLCQKIARLNKDEQKALLNAIPEKNLRKLLQETVDFY